VMREGTTSSIVEAMNELARDASKRGIAVGRVVGPTPGYGICNYC
jgi:hypothetical protein